MEHKTAYLLYKIIKDPSIIDMAMKNALKIKYEPCLKKHIFYY